MSYGLTIDRFDGIYTDISEVKSEIWKRWKDTDLRNKVLEYVGDLPPFLTSPPIALLSRNIATPDNEFLHALKLAGKLGLKLFIEEYHSDKFCTINIDKLCLGKLRFLIRNGGNGGHVTKVLKVIDIHKNDGKQFNKISTYWGESLIKLHHRLFLPWIEQVRVFDNSIWTQSKGNNVSEHYYYFLSLFICHGVLLEDFCVETSEHHRYFALHTVLPAFNAIAKKFGCKPLIVKLIPKGEESDLFWQCYPNLMGEIDSNI